MSTAARNRYVRNFVICFYCKENFRSLIGLSKHYCSAEENISLPGESHEIDLDVNDVDLSQVDWDMSNVDLSRNDWDSHEKPSDTNDCDLDQENSVSSTSNESNICSGSMPGAETVCEELSSGKEITDLASDVHKKQMSETNTDVVREEMTNLVSASLKEPSEDIFDVIKEICDLISESEKPSTEANSDVVKEVSNQASNPSRKQSPVASTDTELNVPELELNVDDELNRAIPDIASKVLQYYEKQTKQSTLDSCCKSPLIEMAFPPSSSPLQIVESSFPKQDDTQTECSVTDVNSKDLSSDVILSTNEANTTQKESDNVLKQNAGSLESLGSNICNRPSSPEVDSSSLVMDYDDSLGYGDDQVESDDSDVSSTISLSGKTSTELNIAELHASKINNNKSLLEENFSDTKNGSMIVKPCFVKIHDIFKSASNSKLIPKKVFDQKKYHVCDVCYKFFRLRSDLSIHYLVHTTAKPYVCNICDKSFAKQSRLFTHHLAHSISRNHVCSVCKKAFPNKSLLRRHTLVHNKEKPFACDKCDKRYTGKNGLKEHYLSHSDEKPFVCEICSASFRNKRYLRQHYYTHQKKEKENVVCEFCFKTYKRQDHLEEHYNIHVNETPHKCNVCGKSFHLLLTLHKHFALVHKEERDLLFQKKLKTLVSSRGVKDPIIQKIEKFTEDHKGDKTPAKKCVGGEGEKTRVKKIEKSSIDDKSKETVSHNTRRKSLTPKKYLQTGSFIMY